MDTVAGRQDGQVAGRNETRRHLPPRPAIARAPDVGRQPWRRSVDAHVRALPPALALLLHVLLLAGPLLIWRNAIVVPASPPEIGFGLAFDARQPPSQAPSPDAPPADQPPGGAELARSALEPFPAEATPTLAPTLAAVPAPTPTQPASLVSTLAKPTAELPLPPQPRAALPSLSRLSSAPSVVPTAPPVKSAATAPPSAEPAPAFASPSAVPPALLARLPEPVTKPPATTGPPPAPDASPPLERQPTLASVEPTAAAPTARLPQPALPQPSLPQASLPPVLLPPAVPQPAIPAAHPKPTPPVKPPVRKTATAKPPTAAVSAPPSPTAAAPPPTDWPATGGSAATATASAHASASADVGIPPTLVGGMVGAGCTPPYPDSARRAGIQGRVVLRVEVAADGTPTEVAVLRSSGSAKLDRAAADALHTCHFRPATAGGHPVPGIAQTAYDFALEN
jgi:protein TonB